MASPFQTDPELSGASQDLALSQKSQEVGRRGETESGLAKAMNVLGSFYNLPAKLVYNFYAQKQGLPSVTFNPTVGMNLSDILEVRDPKLINDPSFQSGKPFYDFASSMALDPTSYIGGGKTAAGGAVKLLEGMGLATKSLATGEKALIAARDILEGGDGSKVLFKSGDVVDPKILTRALPESAKILKTSGVMDDAGRVVRDITPNMGLAEQVRQGYNGLTWAGLPIGGRAGQAKAIETVAKGYDSLLEKMPAVKNWLTTESQKFDAADKILPGIGELMRRASTPGSAEKIAGGVALKYAKRIKEALPDIYQARANRLGTTVQDVAKAMDKDGLDDEMRRILHTFIEKGDTADDVLRQGGFASERVRMPGKKGASTSVDHIVPVDKGVVEDMRPLIEWVKSEPFVANRLRTEGLGEAANSAKHINAQVALIDDYAKRIAKSVPTVESANKAVRASSFLAKMVKAIQGTTRSYRADTSIEANALQHMRDMVLSDANTSLAEKAAALLTKDSRWIGNKFGDVLATGRRADIDHLIEGAKTVSEADSLRSAKELADGFTKLIRQNDIFSSLSRKERRQVYHGIKNVDLGKLFDDAAQTEAKNYYHFGIPVTDYTSATEVAQRTAAIQFWDKTFETGLRSGVVDMVRPGQEVPKGFHRLDDMKFADVPDDIAKAYGKEGGGYVYTMRDDLYQNLKDTGAYKIIKDPMKGVEKSVWDGILSTFDKLQGRWKGITLFTTPAYFVRNFIDDTLRMAFEGSAQDLSARGMALSALSQFSDLPFMRGSGGEMKGLFGVKDDFKLPTATGQKLSAKDLFKEFYDQGVMGSGFGPAGGLGSKETLEKKLMRLGILSGDQLETAKGMDGLIAKAGASGEKLDDVIQKIAGIQENIESMNRLTSYIHFRKTMSADQAAAKTKLVHFDYENSSPLEKQLFQRIFPFYSFKKGITKYLVAKMFTDNFKLRAGLNVPLLYEKLTYTDDERFNRGLIPDFLKDASIQVGRDADGKPRFVSLKGLTSFAEIVDFIKPWDALGSLLSPFIKAPFEYKTNYDTYFDQPIEQYDEQKKNVLGFQVPRKSVIAAIFKNIRPLNVLQQGVETALKGTNVSLFGTKEKKSFFGLGSTDATSVPKSMTDFLAGKVAGIPVTTVDVERQQRNIAYEMQDKIRKFKEAQRRIAKDYRFDPETRVKEINARVKDLQEYMKQYEMKRPGTVFGK